MRGIYFLAVLGLVLEAQAEATQQPFSTESTDTDTSVGIAKKRGEQVLCLVYSCPRTLTFV